MITAQQARELAENKPFFESLDEVYLQIERRAKSGYDFTWIDEKRLTGEQIIELQKKGYIIKADSLTDFKISW
jgi:hypothetical protein